MLRQINSRILKDLVLCFLSAALLILSFPNFNLWILAWFGFVPLFFAIENKSKPRAFLLSYLTGVIYWSGVIYWLVHVTLPGTIILILYLALYFGIFGLVITNYELRITNYELVFIPSTWVILEYIRSHLFTGFPWALLGYSQYLNLPVIQLADIFGAWGISFLLMLANAAICLFIRKKQKLLLPVLIIIVSIGYGYYRLSTARYPLSAPSLRVSVIQGNIPQELKWDPKAKDFIIDKYINLTKQALPDSPDLIIWPEAASPAVLNQDKEAFDKIFAFTKDIKVPLLIGTVAVDAQNYFNSALLIDGSGNISGRYDKLHLVPFGEYIPLRNILPFLETVVPIGDINAGGEYTVLKIQNSEFRIPDLAVLICFEDLFPELSRSFIKKGARFLVNITNDAWYKQTSAGRQHLMASVFRAVENRIFLARAANTGISGFISPSGRVLSLVKGSRGKEIFVDGYKTQAIGAGKKEGSFYTRCGDFFIAVCLFIILYAIITAFKKKK